MHELYTLPLEGSATLTSLAPQTAGLVSTPDRYGHGGERARGQPVDDAGPRGRAGGPPPPAPTWGPAPTVGRAAGPPARTLAPWPRSVRLPGTALDPRPDRGRDSGGMRHRLPSAPCRPRVPGDPLAPATARPTGPPTQRGRHQALARGDVAGPQKGAQIAHQTILFLDESGVYPLPRVVRTYAPVGQTPMLRQGYPRDPLSAISA